MEKTMEQKLASKERYFYLKRDLYKTTSKFVLDTRYYRKYYKVRHYYYYES